MKILCLCHTCALQHAMDFDPRIGPGSGFGDWLTKHGPGHETDFIYPQRSRKDKAVNHSWMGYLHNADVKTAYGASASVSITKASLAASSTLLAGRESDLVDNTTNKYLDYMLSGHFKTAASNAQVGSIAIAVVAAEDDTPTWPDVFDGSDSVETVSLQNVYDQVCKIAALIATTASNSLVWPFAPTSVASLFGGNCPFKFVVFISHNAETSTNAWSSTEGDHALKATGTYLTVI